MTSSCYHSLPGGSSHAVQIFGAAPEHSDDARVAVRHDDDGHRKHDAQLVVHKCDAVRIGIEAFVSAQLAAMVRVVVVVEDGSNSLWRTARNVRINVMNYR